jgi:methylase of polypeptide subunit release factors
MDRGYQPTPDLLFKIHEHLNTHRLRDNLTPLFTQTLNWGRPQSGPRLLQIPDVPDGKLTATPVAQLGTLPVFQVVWPDTRLPSIPQRRKAYSALAPTYFEHILCHVTNDDMGAAFVWARPQPSRKVELRTLPYEVGTSARTTIEQLSELRFEYHELGLFGDPPRTAVLDKLDRAFDVEKVTKRFFKQFADVFDRVEAQVTGIADPARKRLFTQRLFNRLMFITFIQKKGWLRLGKSKNYLRELWEAYRRDPNPDESFYASRLWRLFFLGLNNPDEQDLMVINRGGVLREQLGDVPFLNGGLFEETDDDKDPAAITAPDTAIESILSELFERFNFTVTESTPLDVEVAVDPEMLGKVFEELVTGRHEQGAYYTPKPIVSFMCREALKGYMKHKLPDESTTVIDRFVDEHEPEGIRDHEAVLEALRSVRVCDPACGSGAYLLGMMHELLDLRDALFKRAKLDHATTYARKLEIIQNNLYGVDVDEFAVQIARLRLWLSLAVDYEGDRPKPLPNLDFKIERGDSVIGPSPEAAPPTEFRDTLIHAFHNLKSQYLTSHGSEKKALKPEIEGLREQIRIFTRRSTDASGFDWQVEFAEVFADGGGFDIIVANPPYVRQELIKHLKPDLQKAHPHVYTGVADLYVYFYSRSLQLLRPGGMLVFISSNKWFRANYGAKLRAHIAAICHIHSITDFGDLPVFESATAYPMIFIAQKGRHNDPLTYFTEPTTLKPPYPDVLAIIREQGNHLPPDALDGSEWRLTDSASAGRLRYMRAIGTTLGKYAGGQIYYGIKTGFNDAFYIDGAIRAQLIAEDPRSAEIIKPLALGKDIKRWAIQSKDRWLIVTRIGIDIGRYPAVFKHLKRWQDKLEARWDKGDHWWELRACAYYDAFERPKIVFPDIAKEPRFTYDFAHTYLGNTGYIMPVDDLFLLGVLNSKSVEDFYIELSAQVRGGYLRFIRQYVEQIPIPNAITADRNAIADLAQKCLDAKGVGCEEWEREIDARVARLYGLDGSDVEERATTKPHPDESPVDAVESAPPPPAPVAPSIVLYHPATLTQSAIATTPEPSPARVTTPLDSYLLPILEVLYKMVRPATTAELMQRVVQLMKGTLTQADRAVTLGGSGLQLWQQMVLEARRRLIKEKWIAANTPSNIWKITDKGMYVVRYVRRLESERAADSQENADAK